MSGKSGIIVDMRRVTNWTSGHKEWHGIDLLEALEYLKKYGYRLISRQESKITHRTWLFFAKSGCATTYEVVVMSGVKPWPTMKKEEN